MKLNFFILFFLFLGINAASAIGISPKNDSCDVIAFKNGVIVRGKVTSLTENEIQFRICDDKTPQMYRQDTKNLLSILYSDGKSKFFEDKNMNTSATEHKNKSKRTWEIVLGSLAIVLALLTFLPSFTASVTLAFLLTLGILALLLGGIGILISTPIKQRGTSGLSIFGAALGLVVIIFSLVRMGGK